MMGLKTRLALARTLVWVGLQPCPEVLRELVGGLCAGRADVIVLVQPDAGADDLLLGYCTGLQAADGRAILGLATAAWLPAGRGPLVAADAGVAPCAHEYALTLAVATQLAELERVLDDVNVDAVVVTRLVDRAVALAPPTGGQQTLVRADGFAGSGPCTGRGRRRRLALPTVVSQSQLGMSPRQLVDAYRGTLADTGRRDGAGHFHHAAPRPRPARTLAAGPRRRGRRLSPSTGHRERGPDDHW